MCRNSSVGGTKQFCGAVMSTQLKARVCYNTKCIFISSTVVVMVDVADRWMCGRLDLEVLKCLSQHPDTPAILVLNKVFVDH